MFGCTSTSMSCTDGEELEPPFFVLMVTVSLGRGSGGYGVGASFVQLFLLYSG